MFAFNMSLPVRVILLIVGLEPLDQLGVDGKGVLAVGEGVPHLKARFVDFEMTIRGFTRFRLSEFVQISEFFQF